jgi:hypothetical protein
LELAPTGETGDPVGESQRLAAAATAVRIAQQARVIK